MRRTAAIAAALAACALAAAAQTSNVQTVKAWTRTSIVGIPGGTVIDPTGTVADAQRLAAVLAYNATATNLTDAARSALSNALVRLYAAAARTNDFQGRLYIAADLDPDPDYGNVEAFTVDELVDAAGTRYFVHFTRELEVPPKTVWAHDMGGGAVLWSTGTVATNNATTNVNGFACYDIAVARPSGAGNAVLRTNRFLRFGAPDTPLDIPDAGLRIIAGGVTNTPYTGSVFLTNTTDGAAVEIVEAYLSGFLYTTVTNALEGL